MDGTRDGRTTMDQTAPGMADQDVGATIGQHTLNTSPITKRKGLTPGSGAGLEEVGDNDADAKSKGQAARPGAAGAVEAYTNTKTKGSSLEARAAVAVKVNDTNSKTKGLAHGLGAGVAGEVQNNTKPKVLTPQSVAAGKVFSHVTKTKGRTSGSGTKVAVTLDTINIGLINLQH